MSWPIDEQSSPPDPKEAIEREPPGWGVLPVAIVVIVLVFFVLVPWLGLRWAR